ncbi:MAG TPA: hypothetical protein VFP34_16640 [Microlunatus sp.]|nr:hypothetical protein [Microlunatus sp.]
MGRAAAMSSSGDGSSRRTEPRWGADRALVDGWALADAEVVLRLLLPARTVDDEPLDWRRVMAERDGAELAGVTDWGTLDFNDLTTYPGDGRAPQLVVQHPAGRFGSGQLATLAAIPQIGAARWFRDEQAAGASPQRFGIAAPGHVSGDGSGFASLSAGWTRGGFRGRVWTADRQIALAAPGWADSVIVSAPRGVADDLLAGDLEVAVVRRCAPLPITTD